jgi:peroxiredoxin Q/BCP
MGREYMGIARTTFVIGQDGKIKAVFPNVKVEGHADKVLYALKG